MLAPDAYVGAVEAIPLVVAMVQRLQRAGAVYDVDGDLYFSVAADPPFGEVSGWDRDADARDLRRARRRPRPAGQEGPARLPALAGRAARRTGLGLSPSAAAGPAGTSSARAIAREHLGAAIDVQGGGSDLVFPHHEMSASEAQVAEPGTPFARAYVHAGMVGLDGEKMSKSKGNLVLVSRLREQRHRPDGDPAGPAAPPLPQRLGVDRRRPHERPAGAPGPPRRRRAAVRRPHAPVVEAVLAAMAEDLDAPTAVDALTTWAAHTVTDTSEPGAGDVIRGWRSPRWGWSC